MGIKNFIQMRRVKKALFDNNKNKPIPEMKCPECNKPSKIYWGWGGVYYDLACPKGHQWTYDFKTKGARPTK